MAGTITHSWNGTILTITSDSGTSSMNLKGAVGDIGPRGPQGPCGIVHTEDGTALVDNIATVDMVEDVEIKIGEVEDAAEATARELTAHKTDSNAKFAATEEYKTATNTRLTAIEEHNTSVDASIEEYKTTTDARLAAIEEALANGGGGTIAYEGSVVIA